jgi:hypothetical protein
VALTNSLSGAEAALKIRFAASRDFDQLLRLVAAYLDARFRTDLGG